ncbi:unnamed protein product [Echinostoma caproni]|uniref:Ashwin n=1 Tax=Echinostoma caproni TaxID=27848 RepID=A0A183A4P3_9TREM|nr:unnamed protein product [Echinostoma caproni]
MSRVQLLELLSRRGFDALASTDDPFHKLVDLYYHHIMPIPQHEETSEKSSSSRELNGTTTPPETRLEDLVITSDPRRFTPGYSTSEANHTERVLTVRKPKGLTNGNPNHIQSSCSSTTEKEMSGTKCRADTQYQSSADTADSESVSKKRVQLKRDFTNLV